ncbi:glycoside hydrolase family protein [Dechloromonas agitata]|uniref:glycoside hydrolase family protein n=1 Tax=Dechloromonas agitata TaxID=73030 RepID=UPI00237DB764|nr:glycoside hydrolase family protein [Dechloromonas agitata]MDE1545930.1 glycoside hydrolase family protein [Dechloromonas agitata]
MIHKFRAPIAALVLSAAGFAGIALQEGYTDKAIIPVPGDVPTYGLGSTKREDGGPVRMTDTITPPKAIALAVRDISAKESVLKRCFGEAMLTQGEYDAFVDLAYNVGPAAVCRSSIPGKVQRGEYAAACRTILDFKKVQGRDCSAPENKRFCGGVWTRRQAMYRVCTGEPQ